MKRTFVEIIRLFSALKYEFMLSKLEEGIQGDQRRARRRSYNMLHDLKKIITSAGATGEDRAGSAVITPNFKSHLWNLQPADVVALVEKFGAAEITKTAIPYINFALVRESCDDSTKCLADLDAALAEVKKEIFCYCISDPIKDMKESMPFFIKKMGEYDPKTRQGTIATQTLADFFVRWGYCPVLVELALLSLGRDGIVREYQGNLLHMYESASDVYNAF